MYCSECGKPAAGKFCSNCGTPLAVSGAAVSVAVAPTALPTALPAAATSNIPGPHLPLAAVQAVAAQAVAVGPANWENEWRYDELVKVPEVRQMIERHTAMARAGISAEQFTKYADKILQNPLPSDKLAAFAQPIFGSFGIRTGKDRTEVISAPVGRVMLRVLCSLARHNQSLRGVQQASDGCTFTAVLPSDPMSLEGEVVVTVRRRDPGTELTAAMKITGQLYDWGKCRRALDAFFTDMQIDPT
jgi:hypothetical protein